MPPSSANPVDLPVRFTGTYRLMEIPPRCRKPRPVSHEADFTLPVRGVTDAQAPIAITYTGLTGQDETVLRFFDGQLYRQATHRPIRPWPADPAAPEATEYGSDGFPANARLRTSTWDVVDSLEAVKAQHADYLARHLVVDGLVWERASEPRYVVAGGQYPRFAGRRTGPWTHLTVSDTDTSDEPRHIFRADQHAAALADALEMAGRLGVDAAQVAELAARAPQITVHVPAAVQLVIPEQEHESLGELRTSLGRALYDARDALHRVDLQYGDPVQNAALARQFAEAFAELTDVHGQILALTDDVIGVRAVRRPFMPQDVDQA